MKSVLFLIIKKRWYLLLTLCMSAFLMNLFIWNETSQFIRILPTLQLLKSEQLAESFDIVTYPNSQFRQIDNPNQVAFREFLLKLANDGKIYYNKNEFFKGQKLLGINSNVLEEVDELFFLNDIILKDVTEDEKIEFIQFLSQLDYTAEIVSFQEQYNRQYNYYKNNFIFGLGVSIFLLVLGLALLWWLLKSIFIICSIEIKVLRIIGLSNHYLTKMIISFLSIPILLSLIIFLSFIKLIFPFGIIIWDYFYLGLMSFLQIGLLSILTIRRVREENYA